MVLCESHFQTFNHFGAINYLEDFHHNWINQHMFLVYVRVCVSSISRIVTHGKWWNDWKEYHLFSLATIYSAKTRRLCVWKTINSIWTTKANTSHRIHSSDILASNYTSSMYQINTIAFNNSSNQFRIYIIDS